MLQKIEVGKVMPGNLSNLEEGIVMDMDTAGIYLRIAYRKPTPKEIDNIRNGTPKFGVIEVDGVMFFLCKFGNLNYMDAPYHVRRSADFDLQTPDGGKGYFVTIVLLDADTGVVKALRYISLPTGLSVRIKNIVDKQRGEDFDLYKHDEKIAKIYTMYNTSDLVKMAERTV